MAVGFGIYIDREDYEESEEGEWYGWIVWPPTAGASSPKDRGLHLKRKSMLRSVEEEAVLGSMQRRCLAAGDGSWARRFGVARLRQKR